MTRRNYRVLLRRVVSVGVLGAMAVAYGATLIYRPVLLVPRFTRFLPTRGKGGSATDALNDAKKKIANVDYRRTLARSGVTLNWNPSHPVRSVKALRLLHSLPEVDRAELTNALYKAYWVDGKPSTTKISFSTLRRFEETTPGTTWREEEALFFDQDRLQFVASMLGGRMIPQPRASIAGIITKPKVLTFYYDISSPWAFVGYQLLQRFLGEVKNVKVELVPIVVGGLFKMLFVQDARVAVVPRLAYSPVNVAYGGKDMIDWVLRLEQPPLESTGKLSEPKVELQLPSIFPIRSVLPLRATIVEPKTIYRAAWIRDINVANPTILAKLLTDNAFDAKSLLEKADSAEVKETLLLRCSQLPGRRLGSVLGTRAKGGVPDWP
ncbi:hypothetical protein BJ742DRAFT_776957 [Cladochytrium replicatum]|nr:hypothetical protein BJ742DRAFT_776957 [Cladochytrium replicatum]